MADPILDAILNTNPAPPVYTGTAYAAPANSPASQAAQQVNPGVGDLADVLPAQQGSPLPSPNLTSLAPDPTQQSQQQVQAPGGLKGMLKGFLWGMSRGMMAHAGIESPEQHELKQRQLQLQQSSQQALQQHYQNQDQQYDIVPYKDPQTGQVYMVQRRDLAKIQNSNTAAASRLGVADKRLQGVQDTNQTRAAINQNTLDSLESRNSDSLASKLKVAALQGNYSLRRAAISASGGGGSSAADYLPALANGLPITAVPSKLRGQALAMAKINGINVAFQKLSPSAQKMTDSISELSPVLNDLITQLEPHKTENDLGDYGKALTEGAKYKLGIATSDPLYQQVNKVGNLVKVLGATPYTTVGRGKYLFDEIQKHLPRPGLDTPQLMYEKARTLDGLLQQMEQSINQEQFKGPQGMGGGNGAPPPGAKVRDYTQIK